jgi:hypothetical protein
LVFTVLITVVVLSSNISPVPDIFDRKQEQPTKHEHSRKGFAAILMNSAYKNGIQEDRKREKTRDQGKSSNIGLQKKRQSGPSDTDVLVVRGDHEMKRVIFLRL